MKSSSKPRSSPARTDDFQPPLIIEAAIMFPRTKSNRGSRSRSNSNHLFVRKIDTEANQEPSSPKVTCIGQVRSKRLNNNRTTTRVVRRCKWVRKLSPTWFQRVWREKISGDQGSRLKNRTDPNKPGTKPNKKTNKSGRPDRFSVFWARNSLIFSGRQVMRCLFLEKLLFFGCDCCRNSEKLYEPDGNRVERDLIGACNDELVLESGARNVFLLTRSRSAPYRSESNRVGEKMVVKEEDEVSINGVEGFKADVVKLSRCKSEPARTRISLL